MSTSHPNSFQSDRGYQNPVCGGDADRPIQERSVQSGNAVLFLMIGVWGIAIAFSYHSMLSYAAVPGVNESGPVSLPGNLNLVLRPDRWTLIMFAHPRCPCTRASLVEFSKIVSSADQPVDPVLVFYRPKSAGSEWVHTDLWEMAEKLSGVQLLEDPDGVLAQQFQANCSGVVFAYDPQHQLRYQGGVTGSRGHLGENRSELKLMALLRQSAPSDVPLNAASGSLEKCSVFGCPLTSTESTSP